MLCCHYHSALCSLLSDKASDVENNGNLVNDAVDVVALKHE